MDHNKNKHEKKEPIDNYTWKDNQLCRISSGMYYNVDMFEKYKEKNL